MIMREGPSLWLQTVHYEQDPDNVTNTYPCNTTLQYSKSVHYNYCFFNPRGTSI